jgi:hypothetical protein
MSSFSFVMSPGAADGEAGARERVAADEDFGETEFAAQDAHLVLEQFAQGLDQLHVHALRQTADIVVRLDGHRGAAGEGDALDHIRIERALREEIRAAELFASASNTSMNRRPMVLRFTSGSVTPASSPKNCFEASPCTSV